MEVMAVNVGIYSQKPLKDGLYQVGKLLREWGTDLRGEDVIIIEKILNPVHEVFHIFASW